MNHPLIYDSTRWFTNARAVRKPTALACIFTTGLRQFMNVFVHGWTGTRYQSRTLWTRIWNVRRIPECLQGLYDQYKDQPKRPSSDETAKALHSVSVLYSKIFIIIDALDECRGTDGCRARLLSEDFRLQVKMDTNIFVTSRFIPEIQESFEESVTLEIRARDDDIEIYLANHMTRFHSFVFSDVYLQEIIKTTISEAIDGMCVWTSYFRL